MGGLFFSTAIMLTTSLVAFLHFIFAFGVAACIIFEKVLFRQELNKERADLLRKTDSLYGLSAILVLVIGFLRVFYFEKGSAFYFASPFFHLKLTLFIIIGLLSIYPTIVFLKWRKLKADQFPISLETKVYSRIQKILTAETILIILLMLSASLMAKGLSF